MIPADRGETNHGSRRRRSEWKRVQLREAAGVVPRGRRCARTRTCRPRPTRSWTATRARGRRGRGMDLGASRSSSSGPCRWAEVFRGAVAEGEAAWRSRRAGSFPPTGADAVVMVEYATPSPAQRGQRALVAIVFDARFAREANISRWANPEAISVAGTRHVHESGQAPPDTTRMSTRCSRPSDRRV